MIGSRQKSSIFSKALEILVPGVVGGDTLTSKESTPEVFISCQLTAETRAPMMKR
jgi:hypothetical protein